MQILHQAVDSINISYKIQKDTSPIPNSLAQGKGFYVVLHLKKDARKKRKAIIKDLQQQISLKDFQKKYTPAIQAEALVLKIPHLHTSGSDSLQTVFYFYQANTDSGEEHLLSIKNKLERYQHSPSIRWVYQWKKDALEAFYFPEGLNKPLLPAPYVAAAHYAQTLLDPTIPLVLHPLNTLPTFFRMHDWFSFYRETLPNLSRTEQQTLIDNLRRMNIEVGCGADESLCYHAIILAKLAAQTGNYALFIKAHLEGISNYSMVYDLGYYYESNQPIYHSGIRELEHLNIDLTAFTVGLLLHTSSYSFSNQIHYSSILQRALVDAKNREQILQQIAAMIQDKKLDPFHRRVAAKFYHQFLFFLPKEGPSLQQHIALFKTALHSLPSYLKQGLTNHPSTRIPRSKRRGNRH
ncbi:MAG: hypothetical protein ACRBFS_02390 [Aureispira sp.]